LALVDAAADAGADVVKFQTFSADRLATTAATMAQYQERNTGAVEPQIDMLRRLELDRAAHITLMKRCVQRGIAFMSSPFDLESLNFLVDELDLPTIKIPSGEITNGPLLFKIGQSCRRAILSTGMAGTAEIAAALDLLAWGYLGRAAPDSGQAVSGTRDLPEARSLLVERVTVLQCTTEYPAPFDTINLRTMATLRAMFGLAVGLSDHSEGIAVPIAAVALGASMIEKHLTLDRSLPGPDHRASIEPGEFARMVEDMHSVAAALGSGDKEPLPVELPNRAVARKSLVASRSIAAGTTIKSDDLTAMRPGTGVSPMEFWRVVGSTATRSYERGDLIEWPKGR
jgi:N-acetylneuraminate synthase